MNPIVGIGELLWDVYPDGRKVAGGAPFNFAFHCHQLGHPAVVVSRVGDDDLGRELREEVRRLGLSDEYIQTDREHPTGTVRVTLDENKVPSYAIAENVAWDHIAWNESLSALRSEDSASRLPTVRKGKKLSRPRSIHHLSPLGRGRHADANASVWRVRSSWLRSPPLTRFAGRERVRFNSSSNSPRRPARACSSRRRGRSTSS